MGSRPNRKVLVAAQRVPRTLLSEYIEKWLLPNVRRIVSRGYSIVQIDASITDVSSTWASFITGVNSGEHGIFGFTDLHPGAQDVRRCMVRSRMREDEDFKVVS